MVEGNEKYQDWQNLRSISVFLCSGRGVKKTKDFFFATTELLRNSELKLGGVGETSLIDNYCNLAVPSNYNKGGGFKHFVFSQLVGEDLHFD